MKHRLFLSAAVLVVTLGFSQICTATTWAPEKVKCPLCSTENQFMGIMSYGSYIYMWPSRFQYIYWPLIDDQVLYSCSRCHLTAFMWDFREIPAAKAPDIMKALEGVKVNPSHKKYTDIPMTERLEMAEKVYLTLDKDEEFWCRFFRVKAYHQEEEKQQKEADLSRGRALTIAEKMLGKKENEGKRKELLFITGAMRHFLKDEKGAMSDFRQARGLQYSDPGMKPENNQNFNSYLDRLLDDYIKVIEEGKSIEG